MMITWVWFLRCLHKHSFTEFWPQTGKVDATVFPVWVIKKRPLKGVNQATLVDHSKEPACNAGDLGSPWVGKIRWRRECQSTPVFLPGESHGQRSLAGYNWWGHKELDMTEWLTFSLFKLWLNRKLNPGFLAPNAMVSVWFFHEVVLSWFFHEREAISKTGCMLSGGWGRLREEWAVYQSDSFLPKW